MFNKILPILGIHFIFISAPVAYAAHAEKIKNNDTTQVEVERVSVRVKKTYSVSGPDNCPIREFEFQAQANDEKIYASMRVDCNTSAEDLEKFENFLKNLGFGNAK